jgi:hypothetical protein
MKYFLFNDTSHTNNPGCKGTVAALHDLLAARGMQCARSFPVDFSRARFEPPPPPPPTRLRRLADRLRSWRPRRASPAPRPRWAQEPRPFDPIFWEAAACSLESDYAGVFHGADLVVINGEGTLHHNSAGSLPLVAWARAAKRRGLPVWLVNCTVQDLHPFLLDTLIASCARIVVREPRSHAYLAAHGARPILSADALFSHRPSEKRINPEPRRCLYTPGVLAADQTRAAGQIEAHLRELRDAGLQCTYLVVENEDELHAPLARSLGANVQPLLRWSIDELDALLQGHDRVVSGRYHILIFSWLAGRPVVPLGSNTWKIEALLEAAGLPPATVNPGSPIGHPALERPLLPAPEQLRRLAELALRNVTDDS